MIIIIIFYYNFFILILLLFFCLSATLPLFSTVLSWIPYTLHPNPHFATQPRGRSRVHARLADRAFLKVEGTQPQLGGGFCPKGPGQGLGQGPQGRGHPPTSPPGRGSGQSSQKLRTSLWLFPARNPFTKRTQARCGWEPAGPTRIPAVPASSLLLPPGG